MNYLIHVGQMQITPDGELPRGYYFYTVRAVMSDGTTLDLANTLKVYAPYSKNSVGLFWDQVPGADSYQLFRRTGEDIGKIETYGPAYFFDNGLIEFDYGGED